MHPAPIANGKRRSLTTPRSRPRPILRPEVEPLDSRLLLTSGASPRHRVAAAAAELARRDPGPAWRIPTPVNDPALAQRVQLALEPYLAAEKMPGIGVSIVKHGKIVLDQGYGDADVASGTPVTSDTRFGIASVTKSFTGLGVMLLYQKSRSTAHPINLNAPIGKYITKPIELDPSSGVPFTLPAAWSKITVRQLLTMSSGLQRGQEGPDPGQESVDVKLNQMSKTLLFTPGTQFYYSNVNTWLLGALIQAQDGRVFGKPQSYTDFITSHIFKPLGMTRTTFLHGTAVTTPGSATPYNPHGSEGWQSVPPSDMNAGQSMIASGDIFSTPHDMSLYLSGLLNGKLLTRQTYRTFWGSTPLVALASGGGVGPGSFVLAGQSWDLAQWTNRGPAMIQKGGTNPGYMSMVDLYPLTKDGIFITYNIGPSQTVKQPEVINAVHAAMQTAAIQGTVVAPPTQMPQGLQVYVDVTGSGTLKDFDPSTYTGPDGSFLLNNIPAGTWTIRVVPPRGDTATSATLTVAAGHAYTGTNLTIST